MSTLQNILNTSGFKIGVELVSTRGILEQEKAQKIIQFGEYLSKQKEIDWISITENAGGHPSISPSSIGKKLLNKGKEIIIHLTCKDLNRNGLESRAWELSSEGFQNILALTGDYPTSGLKGSPKPVFDIDSVGLLYLLNQFNNGLQQKKTNLQKTHFYLGAVVSNSKKYENELIPQYLKLLKKVEMGASFIINQVIYDAGKMSELMSFKRYKKLENIHMIGNVFVLSKFTIKLFHQNKIPGITLTDVFYKKCVKAIEISNDNGKRFFKELAAKMLAIYKGLGYKAGYIGGIHTIKDYKDIMQLFKSYAKDDWKQFAKELQFHQKEDFFMFEKDAKTGLTTDRLNKNLLIKGVKTKHVNLNYKISKKFHRLLFTKNKGFYNKGKKLCSKTKSKHNAPEWLYSLEKKGKKILFDCNDCGDCSLHEMAYLCPESQCAKNQRNGPCGGSLNAICEVKDVDCIWTRVYDRKKYEGDLWKLLNHSPIIQNHQLRNTSSWGNFWLKKDHCAK